MILAVNLTVAAWVDWVVGDNGEIVGQSASYQIITGSQVSP